MGDQLEEEQYRWRFRLMPDNWGVRLSRQQFEIDFEILKSFELSSE